MRITPQEISTMHNRSILSATPRRPDNNEGGFVLIMALIFLVVLSLMAINSVRMTEIELKIAGNERVAKVNFYNSEMASLEGVQKNLNKRRAEELNPNSENFDSTANPTLKNAIDDNDDMSNLDQDGDGTPLESTTDLMPIQLSEGQDNIVAGRLEQLVVLNQNTLNESTNLRSDYLVYEFTSYGYSEAENGKSLVKIGFKNEVELYSEE